MSFGQLPTPNSQGESLRKERLLGWELQVGN
jgi:hypothetical protein